VYFSDDKQAYCRTPLWIEKKYLQNAAIPIHWIGSENCFRNANGSTGAVLDRATVKQIPVLKHPAPSRA